MIVLLQILALGYVGYFCVRTIRRMVEHRGVAREFGVSLGREISLGGSCCLCVVPMLAILAPPIFPRVLFWPVPLVVLFVVPHLIASRGPLRRLERSGTSRVEKLESVLRDSRLMAFLVGVYFLAMWVFLGLLPRYIQ